MRCKQGKGSSGMILPVSLVLMGCAAVSLAALVSLTQHELRMSERTLAWKAALPVAEAGIEDAMAHLNSGLSRTNNGWVYHPSSQVYRKQRQLSDGWYQVEISNSSPPEIKSTGYTPAPLSTNQIARSVLVKTKSIPQAGIRVKTTVESNSDGVLDSFDSSNPEYSLAGQYVESKRKDNCLVATISAKNSAIDLGNRDVAGFVGTGGGTVSLGASGKVGSSNWLAQSSSGGKIEPGHFFSDFSMTFTNVEPPFKLGLIPLGAKIGTNQYKHVFVNGDYVMNKLSLNSDDQAFVAGKTRLLIKDGLKITAGGQITISPGGSLTLYMDGPFDATARGFVNLQGRARFLQVFGTTNCQDFKLVGGGTFIGKIYAPSAEVSLGGHSTFIGHIDAESVDFGGQSAFHADEDGAPVIYRILSWAEL